MRVSYIYRMRKVIETPTFQKQAEKRSAKDESLALIDWIAANPLSADVIPGADGARKVRWGRAGKVRSDASGLCRAHCHAPGHVARLGTRLTRSTGGGCCLLGLNVKHSKLSKALESA